MTPSASTVAHQVEHAYAHMLTWEDARIAQLIADVDGLVHLAATSRVIAAQGDPTRCWDNNVRLTASIVRAVTAAPHKPWMIYPSSREVYGQAAILPVTDHTPLAPLNIYGSSKAAAETLIDQAISQFELNAAILRFSTVYGGIQDHADRVMPAFVLAAMKRYTLMVSPARTYDAQTVSKAFKPAMCSVDRT